MNPERADAAVAWTGEFGRAYTQRNTLTADELDALCLARYGTTRRDLNRDFLAGLPFRSVLEVGCNVGQQLRHLRFLTDARLAGVEIQEDAARRAREALPSADIRQGQATALPFLAGAFDLVFTSAVLIHVPPQDLGRVMDEMHRVSARWIWGLEYFHEEPLAVTYRGREGLLWKRDFSRAWRERFPDLRLLRERRLPYRSEPGLVDTMYLFEKA